MKKIYILLSCIFFALSGKSQQDPQYNLYQFNQMVINPAYAGARDGISVIASGRQQWSGFDGAPRTSCMSVHAPVMNKHLGVGLTIVQDAMGPRKMFAAYGNVAYILKLNAKFKLSFGVNAGYNRFQFEYSKLTYKIPENSPELFSNQSNGVLDLNSGLYLRSNSFFAGLSFTHLTQPKAYEYNVTTGTATSLMSYSLKNHMFFTLGKSFKLNDNVIFAPTAMIKGVSKGKGSADLNLNFFIYKKAWLGVFMRGGYGVGFLTQYYITNKFRVGYSFDSGFKDARKLGAAHEIIIGFDFSENKSKIISPRFL